ncbi:MAG: glycosyltransferase family 39 protein [Acidobacteriota bacterium]
MNNPISSLSRRELVWVIALLVVAATFRIAVAHWLPNDTPDDGRVYAQIARNVLEQHVYSIEAQPPYDSTLIRLPGYPLFVAAVYSIFGHTSNGAVRIVQALIDTATCALIALLAFYWQPDERKKRVTAIAALALAAICPFTTIYSATILTEVPTNFLLMAMMLAATIAWRKSSMSADEGFKASLRWWIVTGVIGGVAVLFRPDSGLFVAAVGITLVISGLRLFWSAVASAARHRFGLVEDSQAAEDPKRRRRLALPAHSKFTRTVAAGSLFSLAFVLVLAPWTIRNWRVFHLFQPLAPAHAEMPGEFVPRGYLLWLRTWLDDERYIAPFLWSMDSQTIDIKEMPASAFDSAEEKNRVAALLDKYNHPDGSPATNDQNQSVSQPGPSPTPQSSPSVVPSTSKIIPAMPGEPEQLNKPSPAKPSPTAKTDAEETGEENEENDNSSGDQGDESDNGDSEETDQPDEPGSVAMTPETDAGFAQIARERVARHPFRFYVWLPLKRAHTMWFDTHSQYWPFEGNLLPFEDLDYEHRQQIWLPLFAALTAVFTLLALAGGWLLWISRLSAGRIFLLLTVIAILLRLILFSAMENPEPRYLVEFFPFLSILGGIAIAGVPGFLKPQMKTGSH